MKSKMASILISLLIVTNIFGAIAQNAGVPSSNSKETIGLPLSNIKIANSVTEEDGAIMWYGHESRLVCIQLSSDGKMANFTESPLLQESGDPMPSNTFTSLTMLHDGSLILGTITGNSWPFVSKLYHIKSPQCNGSTSYAKLLGTMPDQIGIEALYTDASSRIYTMDTGEQVSSREGNRLLRFTGDVLDGDFQFEVITDLSLSVPDIDGLGPGINKTNGMVVDTPGFAMDSYNVYKVDYVTGTFSYVGNSDGVYAIHAINGSWFSDGKSRLYVISGIPQAGDKLSTLYEINPDTGKTLRTLGSGPSGTGLTGPLPPGPSDFPDLKEPPVADAGPDQTVNEGDVVQFDGSNSKGSTIDPGQVWTKYAGNPVLDLGPSGSWEETYVTHSFVLYIDGVYRMWYSGKNSSNNYRIGYANSTDGITWIKYSGNPVLDLNSSGSWDDTFVEQPTVVFDGSTFHMWYSGYDGLNKRIGYATSSDGLTWAKYAGNPVLDLNTSGSWDDFFVMTPFVIDDGGTYKMWYTGDSASNRRIGYATSPDGITWTKYAGNPVLDIGAPGSWDDVSVLTPKVIYDGSTYKMLYGGYDGATERIGYASSLNGIDWNKGLMNPVLDIGSSGSWDEFGIHSSSVLYNDTTGTYHMWYRGFDGTSCRIGYANSSAGSQAQIVSYEWDFDSDVDSDGDGDPTNDMDAIGSTPTHVYGDDGKFIVTLRVTDNDNLSAADTCNITVLNVDPKVTIKSVIMDVEIGLRVAGRKYNNVSMALYEEGNPIGYVSIERMPGSPNDQMAWIPVTLNMTKTYNATVFYTPEDPPNIGGNPVWIYIKFQNGSIEKIHHTFNVQQSKKRDSDHWNHVEPWEVDLNAHLIGQSFEITSYITDPGSDDETLTYTYGSQTFIVKYLNNLLNPDPFPSPEVKPVDTIDTTILTYEGPGTITLIVEDDDNIRLGVGQGSDSFDVV